MQYNDGIPPDSRFANHKDFFKDTLDSLTKEEGLAKLAKVKELTALAEQGASSLREAAAYAHARSAELGCSMAQLALAWVAHFPSTSTVILGATRPEQVLDNLGALAVLPKLTPEVLDKIDAILGNKPAAEVSSPHPPARGPPLLIPRGRPPGAVPLWTSSAGSRFAGERRSCTYRKEISLSAGCCTLCSQLLNPSPVAPYGCATVPGTLCVACNVAGLLMRIAPERPHGCSPQPRLPR